MPDTQIDTLILGQGLAGSLLAWHLIGGGQKVRVIDDAHRSSASKVAAGLINPLIAALLMPASSALVIWSAARVERAVRASDA